MAEASLTARTTLRLLTKTLPASTPQPNPEQQIAGDRVDRGSREHGFPLAPPHPLWVLAGRALLSPVFRLLGRYRASGMANIPAGAAILASNHLSWADPPAIRMALRRHTFYMANDFLFEMPVLGKLLRIFGAFPVERGRFDREAFRMAEERLSMGHLLTVFPEGGTTVTGVLYPFEGGASMLAMRNNVPIVPVAVTGTDILLTMEPKFRLRWVPRRVTVTFGKPIFPQEIDPSLPRRERTDLLTQRVYDAVAEMLPVEYLPAKGDASGSPGQPPSG